MMRLIARFGLVLAIGACILSAGPAFAQTPVITGGGSVTPAPGTASSILGSGYTVLATQTFTGVGNGSITEDLSTAVVRTSGGTLDYLYQVTNHSGGGVTIDGLNVSDYSMFSTAVGVITDGSTITGASFSNGTVGSNTASRPTPGSTVIFGLNPGLNNGDTTEVLVVATDSTVYNEFGSTTATTLTVNGGSYAQNNTIEPQSPAVPEPGSLVLSGLGLISAVGIFGFRRRRGR
jgi:hypothetical protein